MKSYFFLHGFLGSGNDWQMVKDQFGQNHDNPSFQTVDFLTRSSSQDLSSFETLIHSLRSQMPEQKNIFIGYSLGGRVGLNWLRLFPQDFQQWVFISTHPGLQTEQEKKSRENSDQSWVDKLLRLELNEFIKEWNSQSVFESTNSVEQASVEFDPNRLKSCFQNLSLSRQQDHREIITTHQDRITWIVGERDQKFFSVAQELKKNLVIDKILTLKAGHRVHVDQPAQLAKIILEL